MKMVKKCIIALAVVALLVTTVNAADPLIKKDPGDWPWTYKAITLCEFPVLMDIGHYVQLKECNKRELRLVQVDCPAGRDFPCYSDCEDIEVRANFPAVFGASFGAKTTVGEAILKDTSVYWKDDINQINGGGAWEKLTVCMDAWKVELWKAGAGPGEKQKIGTMTINVKPPDSDS